MSNPVIHRVALSDFDLVELVYALEIAERQVVLDSHRQRFQRLRWDFENRIHQLDLDDIIALQDKEAGLC